MDQKQSVIIQDRIENWPTGVNFPALVLRMSPVDFDKKLGLKFETELDGLDYFDASVLRINGSPFVLRRHHGAPLPGTTLLIDSQSASKLNLVSLFKEAFQLSEADISWTSPLLEDLVPINSDIAIPLHPVAPFERDFVRTILGRLLEPKPRIQILFGPRQVGKTTGAKQIMQAWRGPKLYVSADTIHADVEWLTEQWQKAIILGKECLLVIDEFQKIEGWREVIKDLWDSTSEKSKMRVILLGSNSLLINAKSSDIVKSESLAGRFEKTYISHWGYQETKKAFGFSLEKFLRYGGYPGSFEYIGDLDRWTKYLEQSIFLPVINIDILQTQNIRKQASFTRLFEKLCQASGSEVSFRDLLSDIQESGNVNLIKDYLKLYESVFLFKTLSNYASKTKLKASSPSILPRTTSLVTFHEGRKGILSQKKDQNLLKLAIGQDLLRVSESLYYWREGKSSVDYILEKGDRLWAIQVKSLSSQPTKKSGLENLKKSLKLTGSISVDEETYDAFSKNPEGFLEEFSI